MKDGGLIDEPVLNASSTQQLERCNSLQHDDRQYVTTNRYEDPPIIVAPG